MESARASGKVSFQHRILRKEVLGLLLLLLIAGCAVERGKVYVKDGKRYGVTSSKIWRGRWWNYYERGVSYADGEFWGEAIADFQSAIAQRPQDQRRARTYGLHFIDYFPHRELGIVYYHLRRYPEAISELEASLAAVDNAKAKFYLNKARRSLLKQTGRDTTPPRILLDSPADGLLTNRFRVTIAGRAEDDTYVSAIAINGQAWFVELAAPRVPFSREVALHDGPNVIDIVATDLLGRLTRRRITVRLDRQGPLVSLDRVVLLGGPPSRRARVQGLLSDDSRIVRFQLAGRQVPLRPAREWEFHHEVSLAANTAFIPFEVEDAAGNVTRGVIPLPPSGSGPPGTRQGKPAVPLPSRWAFLDSGPVVSDLTPVSLPTRRVARWRDRTPPVISLPDLTAHQTVYYDTIYLEGKVTDTSAIAAFSINGTSLWRRPSHQLFFGYIASLRPGVNRFHLDGVDAAGNRAQREIIVTREVTAVRRLDARLRVALLPFVKTGQTSALSEVVYDNLLTVLVHQQRFHLVERQQLEAILREMQISKTELADPASAVRIGRIAAAEGVLAGTVVETPQSLEVFARFVDVETAVIMAAEDVYGEDLTLQGVKTLMEGLAWKFRQRFPLVEGLVIQRQGKHVIVDCGRKQAIQQYMKLILFRDGKVIRHPRTGKRLGGLVDILGEARVDAVFDMMSQATLLQPDQSGQVKALDKMITK
jgi:TolB-like protein